MELDTLLYFVALLACPLAMGLMMWMMRKDMNDQADHSMQAHLSETDRLEALREQRRLLEQEITEAEKIAALQARKETLTHAGKTPTNGQTERVKGA